MKLRFSLVVPLLEVLFACGGTTSPGEDAFRTADGGPASVGPGGTADGGGPSGGGPGQVVTGGTQPKSSPLCADPPGDLTTSQRRARECPLGTDALLFARADRYDRVLIEVAPVGSASPRSRAVEHLKEVMAGVLDKPAGFEVQIDAAVASPGRALSIADVRALDVATRRRFADGKTAVFFYLVVDQPSTEDTADAKVLGHAYAPSSMVIYQKTIDSLAGGVLQPSRDVVESTVVAHEFGHIMGLVNGGTAMQSPHEDGAHKGHDASDSCIMYWANNSSQLVANLLGGGVVRDFDAPCRADLAALKR